MYPRTKETRDERLSSILYEVRVVLTVVHRINDTSILFSADILSMPSIHLSQILCILLSTFVTVSSFFVQVKPFHQHVSSRGMHGRTLTPSILVNTSASKFRGSSCEQLYGWLDNFLPSPIDGGSDSQRRNDYPEQYPATYNLNEQSFNSDTSKEMKLARTLLKQTMLEERSLQLVYDAAVHGWDPASFHKRVDGKGAAVIVATIKNEVTGKTQHVGGYNPKGWSSTGGARPSVAAFLFYEIEGGYQKLQKVGGGGLACARDDPDYGISFGPDGLVISMQEGRERLASSKLGPYFEKGPENLPSLFQRGVASLESLKVLTGVYEPNEEIPYSGAVLDMTSG